MKQPLPSLVILGRPNVGKSTLFNRLTGTRRSIVTDEPGITRDRIYGTAEWRGRSFEVIDTGGIVPGEKAAIPREVLRQAQVAIEGAAQLVLVTDARAGVHPLDQELAGLLRRTGKPLVIAANKVDTPELAALAALFYQLAGDVFPVSAEHGLGVDELLDAVTAAFPSGPAAAAESAIDVAILGRPNVGKSTLLNRLAGEERAIVSSEPGTTRDAVDTLVRRGERAYRFVDTAGIRRKGKTKLAAEKLSVMMARRHLERADLALLVVDASVGVTSSDATIASYAEQSGRSVIVVMNKWDLALEAARAARAEASAAAGHAAHRQAAAGGLLAAPKSRGARAGRGSRSGKKGKKKKAPPAPAPAESPSGPVDTGRLLADYLRLIRAKLKFLDYAPVVFLSALTGERMGQLFMLIDQVADARRRRIPTAELNRWLREVNLDRGTAPAGRKPRFYYVTQTSTAPPTFVLFTSLPAAHPGRSRRSSSADKLHFSYQRFLENQLRQRFPFPGTPVRILTRPRKR